MIFNETALPGVFELEVERYADERGFLARTFCVDEFRAHGLNPNIVQTNVSFNTRLHTLRGMHYQRAPHGETKVVRCTRGRILDVVIDLRPESATYTRWFGTELDAESRRSLYIPEGCAHGFLTLTEAAEVLYLMGSPYVASAGAGVRYDDPAFAVPWPNAPAVISERDRAFPPFLK